MNRLIPVFRKNFHSNIIKMNAFSERQNQAEKTIALLKQQISALVSIAGYILFIKSFLRMKDLFTFFQSS